MGNFKLIRSGDDEGLNHFLVTLVPPNIHSCFLETDEIAIEEFENGWLLFNAETMMIYALDDLGLQIFKSVSSGKSLAFTIDEMIREFAADEAEIYADVLNLATEWEQNKLIKRVLVLKDIENSDNGQRFTGKQGVSCRIEEPDGAILYDPEQNAFHVLNPTGLVIWQLLEKKPSVKELVYELSKEFEEIPLNEVVSDIEMFLEDLVQTGFVYEVF